jgi:dinuclear metal center YbgI/SA1388 family protein
MKLKELCAFLDSEVPLSFQEDYDNSGLQVGSPDKEIVSALITLDVTPEVLDEAVSAGCDLILSHHPVIFGSIKRITGRSVTEKILLEAIKKDVAIYSAHTNLDIFNRGVSRKLAEKLNLLDVKVLSPLKNKLSKLVTYVPETHLDKVMEAIFEAGAGGIGNYDYCGFTVPGTGSFRGGEGTKPFLGEKGRISFEKEIRFETVFFSHLKERLIKALLDAHPYEEVAYDIYSLENENAGIGLGCTGKLADPMTEPEFLEFVSKVFKTDRLKYSKITGRMISNVAVCGGSGGSLLNSAISSGADAYVTADLKYNYFLEAVDKIVLIDTGHYESEKCSMEILFDLIRKKFPKFAVRFSEANTNPINYL